MVYDRGGKVWINESGTGWVFLEHDWTGDRLPEDLVEEAALRGMEFEPSSPYERAELGGYARNHDSWLFFLSSQTLDFHGLDALPIYLLCDLNDWTVKENWMLKPVKNGIAITFPCTSKDFSRKFEFKFASACGRWIEPHAHFPSVVKNKEGQTNYLFDSARSGLDVIKFRPIEPSKTDDLFGWIHFRPEGNFGYSRTAKGSLFRVFAPRVDQVELLLHESEDQSSPSVYSMEKQSDGCWRAEISGNAEGMSYMFRVIAKDCMGRSFCKEVTDPYARAMISRNGPGIARSVQIEGPVFKPPVLEDCIVVEAHLRDLLAQCAEDLTNDERLGFAGLSKWLKSDHCYLKKLGANVVELQPVQEFDARNKEEYHWGYMPVNFFSPASVYCVEPSQGSGVDEFAELVKGFHEAEMAVVLDVVYNHMGIPPNLLYLDRELYFMTEGCGRLTNHSGCGNDLHCDAEPVKKLILDSLIYWVETFDVDGFRFDLGELLGLELLTEIEKELKKIKPGILLFAEPWSFRGRLPQEMNQTSYALWSDACREGLLSFVKGERGCSVVKDLLTGQLDAHNLHPCQSVNYLESHDDYSLVDRFRNLHNWKKGMSVPSEVKRLAVLANGLLLLAPGVPMLSAGQDFLRHKEGVRNTYQRGDLNALDYTLCDLHKTEVEFTREMIRLRLSEHGKWMRSSTRGEWGLQFLEQGNGRAFEFLWSSNKSNFSYLVIVNASMETIELNDRTKADFWEKGNCLVSFGGKIKSPQSLPPLSFNWFVLNQ
jgi:pullulanase